MRITHRKLNNLLTLLVVGAALYMIVIPYWPSIKWMLGSSTNNTPYAGQLRDIINGDTVKTGQTSPTPEDNRIVIPSARINQPILEGSDIWVIDNGATWRKNLNTDSPKDIGNTVIVGHRFTYKQPDSGFYHLDKVKVGDKLAVYWQKEELIYEVTEVKTVPATAIEVESNTMDRTLTLYTCTPIITAENRIVVIAKPYSLGETQ